MNYLKEARTQCPDHVGTRNTFPCILVVEDDRFVADMLEAAFRTWGYDVRVARNGQEGLDIVATQSVDGILLDMHMPIMNGRTMLDELRWKGHDLPVLVMSGSSDVRDLRQLLREGAQGFIVKPFQLHYLQKAFSQILLSSEVSGKNYHSHGLSNQEFDA
ncbi:MAG: response regulator [Nitrospirales bacterium]